MAQAPLGLIAAYCEGCRYAEVRNPERAPGYVDCAHPKARFHHVIWEREKGNCGSDKKLYEPVQP